MTNRLPSPKTNLRMSGLPANLKGLGTQPQPTQNTESKGATNARSPTNKVPETHQKTTVLSPTAKIKQSEIMSKQTAGKMDLDKLSPGRITKSAIINQKPPQPVVSKPLPKQDLRMTFNVGQQQTFQKNDIRKTVFSPNQRPNLKTEKPPVESKEPAANTPNFNAKQISFQKQIEDSDKQFLPDTRPSSKTASVVKPHVIINGFLLVQKVGVGRFGQVYLAKHIQTNFIVAIKKLNKQKIRLDNMVGHFVSRIKILAFMNNPSIMQFYGSFTDQQNVYLILEYIEGGILATSLPKFKEYDVFVMMRQLSIAIKYLHDHGLSHRQLKPEYIMLNNRVAKLTGFDQAAKFKKGGHGLDNPGFDLWCMGMLLYSALTGKTAFDPKSKWQSLQQTADPSKLVFPSDVPAAAKDLILSLLRRHPEEQIRVDKLLSHPYLNRPEKQPKHQ